MPWFKIDDGFHGHPKVLELSLPAVGLWTLSGSWCASYLTDGEITLKAIGRLGGCRDTASELVEAGLWLEVSTGTFQFKDWADYQPLKADVEAERDAARERMKKVRANKKGTNPEGSAELPPNVQPNDAGTFADSATEVRVTPSHPVPSLPLNTSPLTLIPGASAEKKKPEIRIPNTWAPTASHIARAKEKGVDVMRQAEAFKLHAETHDRRAANWNAAFTTWLIKAKPEVTALSANSPWNRGYHQ